MIVLGHPAVTRGGGPAKAKSVATRCTSATHKHDTSVPTISSAEVVRAAADRRRHTHTHTSGMRSPTADTSSAIIIIIIILII